MKVNRLKQFILMCALLAVSIALAAQVPKIGLNVRNSPLGAVLEIIEKQIDKSFFYEEGLLDLKERVSIHVKDADLATVIHTLFNGSVVHSIMENHVVLKKVVADEATTNQEGTNAANATSSSTVQAPHTPTEAVARQDQHTVRGIVYDNENLPLPGAAVVVKGNTRKFAIAGTDGRFELVNIDPMDVLVISCVGYEAIEVPVNRRGVITINLAQSVNLLQDVVVTGYQTISKERTAGSYTILTENDLANKLQPDILSLLEGMSVGLSSYKNVWRIRGTSTLSSSDALPLIIVDGFPYEGSLDAINPVEVARVTILKDAAAASIYGAKSANGVIVIVTRKGTSDKATVEYAGRVVITPWKDNREYTNIMNSAESVNFQQEMFELYHSNYSAENRFFMNEVWELLHRHENNLISVSDFERQMNAYRNRDNYDEIKNIFFRTAINHSHNISIRGGTTKSNYATSLNYRENMPYDKDEYSNRIGYNVKASFQVFDWFRADFGILGSITRSEKKSISSGFSADEILKSGPSYRTIYDENGSELQWYPSKSQSEIDRLLSVGLLDETFYPLQERKMREQNSNDYYNNISATLNFKLFEGFSVDVMYQTEKLFSHSEDYYSESSYYIKNMVNNGARIDADGDITYLFPIGGMITDRREEQDSYTLRTQLNYNRIFDDKHEVYAIAGAERRGVHTTSSRQRAFGYNRISLGRRYVDEATLSQTQSGTQSTSGIFTFPTSGTPFSDIEDRFVAFYGNGSYTYNSRYTLTASIRMDQSNLFGTDPKLQYKPLWSIGAKWHIHQEPFLDNIEWLSCFTFRITKGINGNINKDAGPYTVMSTTRINAWTGENSGIITRPPNSGLRWERTNQTNIGIDFGVLNNRISGGIEYYQKNTSDLLGAQAVDPTSGWRSLTFNYANMYNRGYEITLNTANLSTRSFQWNTSIMFSYNKNKITNLESANNALSNYLSGDNREGFPMATFFAVRWAGLDENGAPQAYKADGKTKVLSIANLTVEDLIESGTTTPPFSGSMIHSFSFKGVWLSCMFIYYGGHVMWDATMPRYLSGEAGGYNLDKNIRNYWKTPEDSNDPNKSPAWIRTLSANVSSLWDHADKHVAKADYVKLREVTLSYQLPSHLLADLRIKELVLSTQIQNIWFIGSQGRKLDPEVWNNSSRGYLNPTVYTLGLSLKF